MYKNYPLLFLFQFICLASYAQTTYLPLNTEENLLLDRLETKSGRLSDSLFLTIKPVMSNHAVDFLLHQRDSVADNNLSAIDRYNISQMISENGEWTKDGNGAIDSKHSWVNTFYKKQYDFIIVKKGDFFVVVNPIISGIVYKEPNSPDAGNKNKLLFSSARGAEIRGWISKKISFYTSATDNQERDVSFVNHWIKYYNAMPGADYYIGKSTGNYDYLQATGYIDFAVVKDHINATFGYDKNFIGDGLTSTFLSDFSSGTPFIRLNTRIWKINYENLYLELTPQQNNIGPTSLGTLGGDHVLGHKYFSMQHLSMNLTRWLNVGLFCAVVFDRNNSYEIRYLNPVIFLAEMEQSLGSGDKKHIGINFKTIAARHLQFYGQFHLDEFTAKNFFSHNGYWANKWALQLGGKYFDAFSVKNLDLQLEVNATRPYTFTHYDTAATPNYSNYNQPLANPLGADFVEVLGILRYQPVKKLFLTVKGMYYIQGVDTGSSDYGSNIFLSYNQRSADYGIKLINGVKTNCALLNFNISYELARNLFIDIGATHRRYVYKEGVFNGPWPAETTTYFYSGIRLNIARRDLDFY